MMQVLIVALVIIFADCFWWPDQNQYRNWSGLVLI